MIARVLLAKTRYARGAGVFRHGSGRLAGGASEGCGLHEILVPFPAEIGSGIRRQATGLLYSPRYRRSAPDAYPSGERRRSPRSGSAETTRGLAATPGRCRLDRAAVIAVTSAAVGHLTPPG